MRRRIKRISKTLLRIFSIFAIIYLGFVLFLTVTQRYLIYRPLPDLATLPSASEFNLPYEDVSIEIKNTTDKMHGWWIPSASPEEPYFILPEEPVQVLNSPKTILYLCGIGRNMGGYHYVARTSVFRQLGFSVLMFDYRGYGTSDGGFPKETQLYEDSQAVWNYLTQVRNIPPEQIIIYGESLGGAIGLDLAIEKPETGGLIMQSTFTSMAEVVKQRGIFQIMPIDLILNQRFDSISKIRSLQVPVLFLHGKSDSVVPYQMSDRLYALASKPKQLFIVPDVDHISIYNKERSYLKAIENFTQILPNKEKMR